MRLRIPVGRQHGALALSTLLLASGVLAPRSMAADPPPGFQDSFVVEFNGIAQMAWMPDGQLFVGSKFGTIKAWDGTTLTDLVTLATDNWFERGLNGMVADPEFLTNGHVWVYYTTPEPQRNRVSRLTYDGTALINESVFLEGPLVINGNHNAGGIEFDSQNMLYIGMGDDGQGSTTAQSVWDLRGKIIRINRDGSAPPGNAFDGSNGDPRIYALGFRNPYRLDIQPVTDSVLIADVGDTDWEELSFGIAGGNFGWANVEGPDPAGVPNLIYPIYSYNHNAAGAAIIGGDFADVGDLAPEDEGNYFFADFAKNEIHRAIFDGSGGIDSVELFATDAQDITDMEFGPDGALYYVTRTNATQTGHVRKIEHVGGGNGQPNANGNATPDSGPDNLQVFLDGTQSSDPDGDTLSYLWDFGHGNPKTTATANHNYPFGVYEATLTVDDGNGGIDVTRPIRIVSGNRRPTATVTTPVDETTYAAGVTIAYSGAGDDVEDASLACSAFTWTFVFHHADHAHPFVGPLQGTCGGTIDIPLAGEPDPNQWYEVRLEVEDAGTPIGANGTLTDRQSVEIRPELGQMTFETSPKADLQLSLDTVPFTAPMIVEGVVNMQRTIGAADQAGDDGHTYAFDSWSDSGAPQHMISTPSGGSTFTANFVCDMQEAVRAVAVRHNQSDGSITLTWPAVSDICLEPGSMKYAVYATDDPRPAIGSGSFPVDPAFNLIGHSNAAIFSYVPGPNDNYFLIIAIGGDGGDGPSGHY